MTRYLERPDPRADSPLAKISRRHISEEEIITRLTFAMINEAANILDEGIAASARDIDLMFVHGYGFPRRRGGPMFYADTIGTAAILNKVELLARESILIWKPSPLLSELAAVNKPFATWKHN